MSEISVLVATTDLDDYCKFEPGNTRRVHPVPTVSSLKIK